jgi:EF-P beta-lysylation protein EpmB
MKNLDWREIQRKSTTRLLDVLNFLEYSDEIKDKLLFNPGFKFLLPDRILQKIRKNDLTCPLAKQFIPFIDETIEKEGYVLDPTGDATFRKEKKILHKYKGRALLICTSACAMHCRYCFRQNFSYSVEKSYFEEEIQYLKNQEDVHEVILSGGDPLSLSDNFLENLLSSLNKINHLKIIRFHTRLPIGIPERISSEFLEILRKSKKQITFVIHANHKNEFDEDIFNAMKKIQALGIPTLMQTVLLKDVNDNLEALKDLFLEAITNGIIPYYLHELDQVKGTSHFFVKREIGLKLIDELRKILPGYAVPRFAKEIPGAPYKTLIH